MKSETKLVTNEVSWYVNKMQTAINQILTMSEFMNRILKKIKKVPTAYLM